MEYYAKIILYAFVTTIITVLTIQRIKWYYKNQNYDGGSYTE
jgi:hypothetical protein